ncbi:hypothetical protein DFH09DRAFT_1282351 [Mycena vulgaris]|nr:hypothetical protein DFH09DRAFT_1282351 [Mycena vulgaris]
MLCSAQARVALCVACVLPSWYFSPRRWRARTRSYRGVRVALRLPIGVGVDTAPLFPFSLPSIPFLSAFPLPLRGLKSPFLRHPSVVCSSFPVLVPVVFVASIRGAGTRSTRTGTAVALAAPGERVPVVGHRRGGVRAGIGTKGDASRLRYGLGCARGDDVWRGVPEGDLRRCIPTCGWGCGRRRRLTSTDGETDEHRAVRVLWPRRAAVVARVGRGTMATGWWLARGADGGVDGGKVKRWRQRGRGG